MTRAATILFFLAAGYAWALPPVVDEPAVVVFTTEPGTSEPEKIQRTSVVRRYEIRQDAQTGRLVRVASRSKRKQPEKSVPHVSPASPVVQRLQNPTGKGIQLDSLVRRTGDRHGVDPELIHAVIRQESSYNPFAVSSKGAQGLMQLMPGTARRFGVKDIFDPAENVEGGVKYLRHLLDRFKGDSKLALAAYNAGEGAVDQYGGVPPYAETIDYVEQVQGHWRSVRDSVSEELAGEPDTRERQVVLRVEQSGTISFEME